jgi:pyroglutamyl-peptidase
MMRCVLVTGFEPFGGERLNPSAEIAQALDGRDIAGRKVIGAVLPCSFGDSRRVLLRLMRKYDPELIVCTGQAGGRAHLTPERVAINCDDARIPDNRGAQPCDAPIARGGPAAYWSTLPIKAIVAALQARGLPASVSQTAGTYVCNHVFYALMHELARSAGRRGRGTGAGERNARRGGKVALTPAAARGGFIHVPWLPEQAVGHPGDPSLSLASMVEGIELAIATTLAVGRGRDRRVTAGAEH